MHPIKDAFKRASSVVNSRKNLEYKTMAMLMKTLNKTQSSPSTWKDMRKIGTGSRESLRNPSSGKSHKKSPTRNALWNRAIEMIKHSDKALAL